MASGIWGTTIVDNAFFSLHIGLNVIIIFYSETHKACCWHNKTEIMKACHEGISMSQESRVLVGHCGRDKMETMIVARWYFLHIFKPAAESIKYCDVCMWTHINCKMVKKTLIQSQSLSSMESDWYWSYWSTKRNLQVHVNSYSCALHK